MNCPKCDGKTRKYGKNKQGIQRYRCDSCKYTFAEERATIRIDRKQALLCLNLLVEGNSIRSTERITGVHRDTIMRLLTLVGTHCERVMSDLIKDIPVQTVEADEIWGYVQKKEGHKLDEEKNNNEIGDAYTLVAIEAKSKLVVCYQLGRRDIKTATAFMGKLHRASADRFQLTTDGLAAYVDAVEQTFGADIDYAQLIKTYHSDKSGSAERRYSPGDFVQARKQAITGNPNKKKISTSYVERQNLTMRMSMRRLTRLTNGFSKMWENLDKALALHFAYYNFCRVHQSLRVTPAMEAGITKRIWTLEQLVGDAFTVDVASAE